MSLAIVACDSVQAVAVSDGRLETTLGLPNLKREDFAKIIRLDHHTCVAATGVATILLFDAARKFADSWNASSSLSGFLQDANRFIQGWLQKWPLSHQMAVALFGWDHRIHKMQLFAWQGGQMRSVSQHKQESTEWSNLLGIKPEIHSYTTRKTIKPMCVVMGETRGVSIPSDSFSGPDPAGTMRELVTRAAEANPLIGRRTFAWCIQAPPEFLSKPIPGRVWPTLDAEAFNRELAENPPFRLRIKPDLEGF